MSYALSVTLALLLAGSWLGPTTAWAQAAKSAPAGAKVDLNSATQAELKKLPGVGEATAKKIIAGRPYSSVADLSKAGVSAKTIDKITPMVSVGGAAPAAKAAPAEKPAAAPPAATEKPAAKADKAAKASSTEARVPPEKGMVWVNTGTGVFHHEGDRWYGKTKEGKFMTEADAVKAGYRVAKEGAAKQGTAAKK